MRVLRCLVATSLVLTLASCAARRSDDGEPTVGAAFDTTSSTTVERAETAPAAAPSAAPTTTQPPAPAAAKSRVANRSQRDIDGWRLVLVVADKTKFAAHEPITFELSFTNISSGTEYTDAAQNRHFGLMNEAGTFVWTDQSCGGSNEDAPGETHAATASQPGESGRFVDRYPISQSAEAVGAPSCWLPPGRYAAVGELDTCPKESLQDASYKDLHASVCRPEAVKPLLSDPVGLEIGSS